MLQEKVPKMFNLHDYSNFILKFRWIVIFFTLLKIIFIGYGIKNIEFQTDYRIFFSDQNPELVAFEKLQNTYSRNDVLQFVLKPDEGDIFNETFLSSISDLTEKFWQIPYTTRVNSLANFQHTEAKNDELIVNDLIPLDKKLSLIDVEKIREVSLNEPLLKNLLISADGRTTAVSATLNLPFKSVDEVPNAYKVAEEIAQKYKELYPDVRLEIVGNIALNNAFSDSSKKDGKTLFPLMIVILLIVLSILLRSISALFITVLIIFFSVIFALGCSGWIGIDMSTPSGGAIVVIMTLAVADAVHLLTTMFKEMRNGSEKNAAIKESMRVNFWPVFLTSLTTMIGFLTLNFSDAPPFNDLGNISAMGVFSAWVLSISFLPALASILPLNFPINKNDGVIFEKLAEIVIKNKNKFLFFCGLSSIILFSMIPRIELNDQFVNYFDESMDFRKAADFAVNNLTGVYRAEWSIPSQGPGGISDPSHLRKLDEFASYLSTQKEVVHVSSITDVFKRLNKNMHNDDNEYYKLPESRELAAQYLLLYEMSLPLGVDLNNQINVKKSSSRVVATLKNISTKELTALDDRTSSWLRTNFPTAKNKKATGSFILFAYITERNINSMLIGTTVALIIISAILIIALHNFKLGFLSLVPNLFPAGMAFGIWYLLYEEVGLAASVITATSLGIIVDDTVHFLSKYQRARTEKGLNPEDSIRYAFSTVGKALFITTIVIAAGFFVLGMSSFQVNSVQGQLTGIAVILALLTDFLLLPPLLLYIDKKNKRT